MTSTSTRLPGRAARVAPFLALTVAACTTDGAMGLYPSSPAATTVKFDFRHRPLPEIPLPNDLATRVDPRSATGLRINAALVAPTQLEAGIRRRIDDLDGWGVLQPIAIPFTGPLDVASILAGHRDPDYATANDVVFLIDVDPDSPELGRVHHLDLGQGNYPVVLEHRGAYGPSDPRGQTSSLLFEETDEDLDGNGRLDPGEDTDADGVLDRPNYLPGAAPADADLAGRADALMTFYERETNTLLATPLVPLRERTTYAVVVTRRLLDASGAPVGSPFPWIHHLAQTEALRPLAGALGPLGLGLDDVAFAFTYTTQSTATSMVAVRDGLYGHGVQHHLGDDFPATVTELLPLRDASAFPDAGGKLHLLYGEQWAAGLRTINGELMGGDLDTVAQRVVIDGQRCVDYYVIGSFDSPQLFDRVGAGGQALPYDDQAWPEDLDRRPARARRERVFFTLAVPRKELSARGQGKPAPLVILNHGHTGQRFTAMTWSAYFCPYGLAVLSIDGPSHGISFGQIEQVLARNALAGVGLGAAATAVFKDRAFDQNGDQVPDSGADFWTAYLFHTRDMVRQYLLDLMQTVRVVRGFDGVRRWALDTNGDGTPDLDGLAGDFDGDGVIDVGGDARITVTGGSLGGMMTMLMGALEPEVSAIAPIVGGGALSTIGIRSTNGGARVGLMVRAMAPIYAGTTDPMTGRMDLTTYVPDLLEDTVVPVASADGIAPGDTLVVENLRNGERGCGLVDAMGQVQAAVASDLGDATRLVFYRGAVIVPRAADRDDACVIAADAAVLATIDRFDRPVGFQGQSHGAGEPLVALAEGLGIRRATPAFRRMQGLAQLVLDAGDPAVYASHIQAEPLTFPGTGDRTGAHAAMIFTEGDTAVPNSNGMVVARAAGLLPYLTTDPRYGVPANQVLIDHHIAEGVHNLNRYTDNTGAGVHIDVENFAGGDDVWGAQALPRLDPPLRLGVDGRDLLGGRSAALFVMTNPQGEHGFTEPGGMIDAVRAACAAACTATGTDPCGCSTRTTYDVGLFLVNMVGRYLASDGADLRIDACQGRETCADAPVLPPARSAAAIP